MNLLSSFLEGRFFINKLMEQEIATINWPQFVFITGIGTDVGKSFSTGWLARKMLDAGLNVITQKFVQTGNVNRSEDIEVHRRLMGIDMQDVDKDFTTAPVIFSYPASPELAARIDHRPYDPEIATNAARHLSLRYDHILIEGAGGIMVPLTKDMLTIDYLAKHKIPTIVVTNGQLGSINHSLLTIYALKNAGIPLLGMIYNPWFDKDTTICEDTKQYLRNTLSKDFKDAFFMEQT